jgi:hypothetical protein
MSAVGTLYPDHRAELQPINRWENGMLKLSDVADNFDGIEKIGNEIVKCVDELNSKTVFYYFKLAGEDAGGFDLVVISEDNPDDEFALFVLENVSPVKGDACLSLRPLAENKYGFTQLLLAPNKFHKYLVGRLDAERDKLILCLPVHKGEFSGAEEIDDFFLLRRQLIETLNWNRPVSPQVQIRFDNPKTGVGTGGAHVLVKYDYLLSEIANLEGAENGFIEVLNYLSSVAEILSHGVGQYIFVLDRDDTSRELMNREQLIARLWLFLTT